MYVSHTYIIYFFYIIVCSIYFLLFSFFFNDTATTEIYTLSLHDALPIYSATPPMLDEQRQHLAGRYRQACPYRPDRKSTRLNSSHANISYAVFCLKKKKKKIKNKIYNK